MYEIWLGLNIVYELALGYIVHIALYLLLLAAFYFSVWRQQLSLRGAVRPTLLFAAVAAVLAMLLVPASTRSSLNEVNYLVDWMNLLGISLGVGRAAGFAGVAAVCTVLPVMPAGRLQALAGRMANRPRAYTGPVFFCGHNQA